MTTKAGTYVSGAGLLDVEEGVEDAALRAILRNSARLAEVPAGGLSVPRAMDLVYADAAAMRHIKGGSRRRVALGKMRLNAAGHPNYRAVLPEHDPEIAGKVERAGD